MKQFCSCVWRPWPKIKTATKIESTRCIRYQGLPFMLALVLSRGLRSLTKHDPPVHTLQFGSTMTFYSEKAHHILSFCVPAQTSFWSSDALGPYWIVHCLPFSVCSMPQMLCTASNLGTSHYYVTMHSINMSMQWWPKCWSRSQLGNVQVSYLGGITWQLSLLENDQNVTNWFATTCN